MSESFLGGGGGMRLWSMCIALLVAVAWGATSAFGQASFQGLGDLQGGEFNSSAQAVSADGLVVVGYSISGDGYEAFRWTEAGGMVGLGDLPGGDFCSFAFGVSGNGSVAVGQGHSAASVEPFRWTQAEGMVALGNMSGGDFATRAPGVSADGSVVVGTAGSTSSTEAFRWTADTGIVGLGYIPSSYPPLYSSAKAISADARVIVGDASSAVGEYREAFRWTASEGMSGLGVMPGGTGRSVAYGVSNDGSIIVGVSYDELNGEEEAFRWTGDSGFDGLGDLPGGNFSSYAYAVSGDGSVVVGQGHTDSGSHEAFVWDARNGMRNLRHALVFDYGIDLTGWQLGGASGVSADGLTIVGFGINPNGHPEGWIARLPEPQPPALLQSEPPNDGTLPKQANNVMLLTFDASIALPSDPALTIEPNGGGADLGEYFAYSVEGEGVALKAVEDADTLTDRVWYRITPAPTFDVEPFVLELCTLRGDANGSGRVTTADYSEVKAHMSEYTDARYDLNGTGRVTTSDYTVVKQHLGGRKPDKP